MAHDDYKDNALEHIDNEQDVEKLRTVLHDTEKVIYAVKCMNDGSDGVLAATDRRIVFCDQRFLSSEVTEFLYSEVAVILSEAELLTTKVALIGIDKALYLDGIDKEHAVRLLQSLEDNIGQDFESSGEHGRHLKHVGELLNVDDIATSPVEADSDDVPVIEQ